jgi:hypothetical protein
MRIFYNGSAPQVDNARLGVIMGQGEVEGPVAQSPSPYIRALTIPGAGTEIPTSVGYKHVKICCLRLSEGCAQDEKDASDL